jgi:hypothetical protein
MVVQQDNPDTLLLLIWRLTHSQSILEPNGYAAKPPTRKIAMIL